MSTQDPSQVEIDLLRRAEVVVLNTIQFDTRAAAEARFGRVWDPDQLSRDFEVIGFLAPYCGVILRVDSDLGRAGQRGSLRFTHLPRWYFDWKADT